MERLRSVTKIGKKDKNDKKDKKDKGALFGKDLDDVCEAQGQEVPFLVRDSIAWLEVNGLDEEGIFRISPDKNSLKKLKKFL